MPATKLDGKATALSLRETVTQKVALVKQKTGKTPGLSVILVGEDPASQTYVANKEKATEAAGMNGALIRLPESTSQEALIAEVEKLNHDNAVNGILVQLPLPKHISEEAVIQAINPDKDVDGFHVINSGRLWTQQEALVPCTPQGCMILLEQALGADLSGKDAIIVGRSNIVGRPMAELLLQANATVTIAHSRTNNLSDKVKAADIVVAAVGIPEMVKGEWIKKGAVVIDVGINRISSSETKSGFRLVGDVAFASASENASHITPVPGGVGPMTIACLLNNTVTAFCRQHGVDIREITSNAV